MQDIMKTRFSAALRLMEKRGIPLQEYNRVAISEDSPSFYLGGHAREHHIRIATGTQRFGAEGDCILRVALNPGLTHNDFTYVRTYECDGHDVAYRVTNRDVYLGRVLGALQEAGFEEAGIYVADVDTNGSSSSLVTYDINLGRQY